jgi:hypothetical protein
MNVSITNNGSHPLKVVFIETPDMSKFDPATEDGGPEFNSSGLNQVVIAPGDSAQVPVPIARMFELKPSAPTEFPDTP